MFNQFFKFRLILSIFDVLAKLVGVENYSVANDLMFVDMLNHRDQPNMFSYSLQGLTCLFSNYHAVRYTLIIYTHTCSSHSQEQFY